MLALCRGARGRAAFCPSITRVGRIGGQRARTCVHVPPSHGRAKPIPVVLALIRSPRPTAMMARITGRSGSRTARGFLFAYPRRHGWWGQPALEHRQGRGPRSGRRRVSREGARRRRDRWLRSTEAGLLPRASRTGQLCATAWPRELSDRGLPGRSPAPWPRDDCSGPERRRPVPGPPLPRDGRPLRRLRRRSSGGTRLPSLSQGLRKTVRSWAEIKRLPHEAGHNVASSPRCRLRMVISPAHLRPGRAAPRSALQIEGGGHTSGQTQRHRFSADRARP